MNLSSRQYCLLVFIISLWAANLLAIKYAVMELPPLTAATLRYFFTGLVFLPFLTWPGKEKFWLIFQISALVYVIHQGLLFIGLGYLGAGSTSVLLQTQVVFATLLGWVVFKEKIGWKTWTGIGTAIAGVAIMMGAPDITSHPMGTFIVLASSFAAALSYIRMKHLKDIHTATYLGLTAFIAVPFLFAGTIVAEPGSWSKILTADWMILAPIFFFQATVLSFTHIWWQRLIHAGDIGKVTSFSLLTPVFAVALSTLFMGEVITWPMVVGGLLAMGGVGIVMLRRIQKGLPSDVDTTA